MNNEVIPILLIADRKKSLDVLRESLEENVNFPCQVTLVDHLNEALEKLRDYSYQVILLSLDLESSQGLNDINAIHQFYPNLPVIVLSQFANEELAIEAIQTGAQDYLILGEDTPGAITRVLRNAIGRQRSMAAKLESEERFRDLYDHAPIAYQSLNEEGCLIDFNPQLAELLGYEPAELIGKSFGDFWAPGTQAFFPRKFTRFKRDGKLLTDLQLIKKDGTRIDVNLKGNVQYDQNGQFIKTHCILYDVTGNLLAEQAIRESQERFASVFRSSPVGIFITSADEKIIDANQAFLQMTGYQRREVLDYTTGEINLWHKPEDRNRLVKLLGKQGKVASVQVKYHKKSGEVGDALTSVELIELGGKQCILTMVSDITEHNRVKDALEKTLKTSNDIVQNIPSGLFIYQFNPPNTLTLESGNPAAEMLTGMDLGEWIGKEFGEIWPETKNSELDIREAYLEVMRTGDSFNAEKVSYEDQKLSGSFRIMAFKLSNEKLAVSFENITERVLAEENVRSARRFLQGIQDSLSSHIAILDQEGVICQVNQAWREFGQQNGYLHPEYGVGINYLELCKSATGPNSDEALAVMEAIQSVMAGKQNHAQVEYPCHSAEEKRWFVLHITSFEDRQQRWVVLAHENITERKEAEIAIQFAEARSKAIIENAPDGIVLIDAEGNFKYISPSARKIFGFGPDEVVQIKPIEATHPDELQMVLTTLDGLSRNPSLIPTLQYRFMHRDGSWLWVESTFSNLLTEPSVNAIVINFREITERKQSELAVLTAEQKYYSIFNDAVEGIYQFAADGHFLTVNPALARMWGYSSPEELATCVTDIARQIFADPSRYEDFIHLLNEKGEVHGFEYQAQRKDGELIWVAVNARAVQDSYGKAKYYEGYVQNINQWKVAETALRESEEQFRATFDKAGIGMALLTSDGRIIESNAVLQSTLGYTVDELEKMNFSDFTHPDDFAQDWHLFEELFAGARDSYQLEKRFICKDKKQIWGRVNATVVRNAEGDARFGIGILENITERKEAEEALHESETRFSTVFHASPLAVALTRLRDNRLLDVNKTWLEATGFSREEVIGCTPQELGVWANPDERESLISMLLNQGTVRAYEMQLRKKSGETVELLFSAERIELAGEECMLSMSLDITDRKKAEERMEFQATLLNAVGQAVITTKPDGTVIYMNKAAEELYGWEASECIGRNIVDVTVPEIFASQAETIMAKLNARQPWNGEFQVRRRDGTVFAVQVFDSPVLNDDGELVAIIGVSMDVTERKQAVEQVRDLSIFNEKILNNSPTGILTYKFSGECTYANETAARIVGTTVERLKAQDFREIASWKKSGLLDLVEKAIVSNEVVTSDIHHFSTFGKDIWLTASCVSFKSKDDDQLLLTISDITQRKQAEEALQESERRLTTLMDNLPGMAYRCKNNPNWDFEFVSDGSLPLTGYRTDELIGNTGISYQELIHPQDRQMVWDSVQTALDEKNPFQITYRILSANGDEKWVWEQGQGVFSAKNEILALEGFVADITGPKKAEDSLRESEKRLNLALAAARMGVWEWNFKSGALFSSLESLEITRLSGGNLNDNLENLLTLVHPEDIGYVLEGVQRAIKEKTLFMSEFRIVLSENEYRWLAYFGQSEYDADEKPLRLIGTVQDITGRKQVEEELRKSENRFRALVNQIPATVYIDDLSITPGQTEYINSYIEKMLGFTPEEWIEGGFGFWKELLHPEDRERVLEEYQAVPMGNGILNLEYRLANKSGNYMWVRDQAITLYNDEGVPQSIHGVIFDINAQKQSDVEIKHYVTELETLYENGLLISGLLEPKKIAQRIVDVLEKNLDWHHIAIRLYHPESNLLELLALSQPGIDSKQIELQAKRINQMVSTPDNGLSGWVIRHGTPVLSGNLPEDPRYLETFPGLKSGLYVPILSGGVSIGSIAVESEKVNAFSPHDIRLLITLANQAAISFDNAKLYSRLQIELSERRYAEAQIRRLNIELEQRVVARTAEIETGRQRMELAASAAGIGIWEFRSGADQLFWDDRMHRIYGTSSVLFQPTIPSWLEYIYLDDRQRAYEKFAQALEEGLPYENEFRIVRADGSLRHISSHAMVLTDDQEKPFGMIGVNLDVTTNKNAEETLRMANIALERVLRVKDEFLANMSHELRTPLNAILGLSESLEEQIAGPLNEKQQKYIHTISESGHHLLTLINDILDLAKIEAGQFDLDIEKVNVHLVCQASLRMITQLAQRKEQNVGIEIDERVDLIWADERRLKQMIVNLLSNAVKFTPTGGKLGLKIEAEPEYNNILVTVWDNGIGIKEDDRERLFKPFVQLNGSLDRENAGTGLGLALVAQMAHLHGGRITVDSAPGEGSRFTIVLPWKPARQTGSLSRRQTGELLNKLVPPAEKQQTILLVEDTGAVVMLLRDYLASAGYRVVVARDGLDGVNKTKSICPDLILMDVMMPGMDGLEATRRIRSESANETLPIIGLTALAMSSDRERCLAAGMDDYLSKPVKLDELLALIQSYLSTEED